MRYRIDWKSTTKWVNTTSTEYEGEEVYATLAEAEAALAEMERDENLSSDIHNTAVEGQGVEGWLEIVEIT